MADPSVNPVPPATDPLDVLTAEHRVIERVLDVVERELSIDGGRADNQRWSDVLAFLEAYADRRHHGKEEELLFPALRETGFEPGLLEVMEREHVEGRQLVGSMRAALGIDDVPELHRAARAYVSLLREHIEKEDGLLFPAAREWLSAARAADLARAFDDLDATLGSDGDEVIARLQGERRGAS